MITAPFNFVPLSNKVYFPDWADQVSHDIPFEDGEDGVITLEINNTTALFVRDGHSKGEMTEWSSHVVTPQGEKIYFIPGTTLKGCFRNVLEVLSFSKLNLNRFDNASFGYRSFTTQIKGVNYPQKMANVKCCGWLYRTAEGAYMIDECVKGIQKISHEVLKAHFKSFNSGRDHDTAEIKQRSLGATLFPTMCVSDNEIIYSAGNKTKKTVPAGYYVVVCTGYMKGKRSEYLFSTEHNTIPVAIDVFKTFDTIHQFTPYYAGRSGEQGFLKKRLKRGDKIPVFFEKNEKGEVVAMGITRMFRYPFKHSLRDCVERISKDHFSERADMPEVIFGHVNKNNSLKGRVQIGNAFSLTPIDDNDCVAINGVLGQPHPSYYPLYLRQEGNALSNYNSDNAILAGRKRYRVTKDGKMLELNTGNDKNEKILTSFRPLPVNQTFVCKICVHNLRKVEIGALLSSLTFNNTPNTYHSLGLAKAYGYGAFTCHVSLSEDFKYSQEEYIKSFNEEISYFLQENGSRINREDCLSRLVSIASATHTVEEMKQMDFKECAFYKEDRNFSTLSERTKTFSISIGESEILRRKRIEKARYEIAKCKLLCDDEALEQFENLKFSLTGQGMEDLILDIQKEIDRINETRKEQEKVAHQKNLEEEQQRIADNAAKKLNAGLAFLTEKKANANELKITELSNGIVRITKFLKQNSNYNLTETDKCELQKWLQLIPKPTKKGELKELCSYDSKSWQNIIKWVGEDVARSWFEEKIKTNDCV